MSTKADHPLKGLLDQIWNAGHTPRLIVNAMHKDVLVPEWLRAQHKDRLVLDLLASYPMNIEFDTEKLAADLAFSGSVIRITVPWDRISVVIDQDTGAAFKLVDPFAPSNDDTPKQIEAPKMEEPATEPPKRKFGVIQGGKSMNIKTTTPDTTKTSFDPEVDTEPCKHGKTDDCDKCDLERALEKDD